MCKAEILINLMSIKERRFNNHMADHWSNDNYRIDAECAEQIKLLEKALAECTD